jgi:hypothetical protein
MPVRLCRLAAALLAVAVASRADAMFIRPDLEKVPVERLTKNLQDLADASPKDVVLRFNLARAHAMAFALKTDSTDIWKGKPERGAWFGFTPKHVPFTALPAKDDAAKKAAKEHLDKALAAYDATLKIDPTYLPAQLGRAWLIEQSGDKEGAIKAYRTVIENGWQKEKDLRGGPLGGNFITTEAAGYLTPLLDKEKDKDEIKTLQERTAKLAKLPRPVTPIAVPLRPGLTARDLEDLNASVAFDADGTGLKTRWTWITPQAGWLVYDPKASGQVTSALQMFGNVSFWMFWENGYEALRALDDDGDGELTGKELAGLAIWHDANGDGVCDPGEVRPLSDYGIVAVSCRWQRDPSHPDRIAWSPVGVRFRDGSTRPTFDLILKPR